MFVGSKDWFVVSVWPWLVGALPRLVFMLILLFLSVLPLLPLVSLSLSLSIPFLFGGGGGGGGKRGGGENAPTRLLVEPGVR